ncbi:hypothetical protein Nmel_002082 [Mimus melanotis]
MQPTPETASCSPTAIPYSSSLQNKRGENKLIEAVALHSTISWLLYHPFYPVIRVPACSLLGTLWEKKRLELSEPASSPATLPAPGSLQQTQHSSLSQIAAYLIAAGQERMENPTNPFSSGMHRRVGQK